MTRQLLMAGGGIGALGGALAATRAGWEVRLYEQAQTFSEVGAGLQLGPNATRILQAWGLGHALAKVASFPEALVARSAASGRSLGRLPLGKRCQLRYGAPYATVHRHDLHQLLLRALTSAGGAHLHLSSPVVHYSEVPDGIQLSWPDGRIVEADALIGADGVWSRVRDQLLGDGPAQPTGHQAFRALVPMADVPAGLRGNEVTAWLGPRLHVVSYPVRGAEQMNLVVIVQGQPPQELQSWDQQALADDVQAALAHCCAPLQDLARAAPAWGRWTLCDRPPVTGPQELAGGRVALLGDAAHPMRPFLAQGAGMALEDAAELGRCLGPVHDLALGLPAALGRYAMQRWQRVGRVQARARRNGEVFHATGPERLGRDIALSLLGRRLMDLPWLYGHGR
jgi:salicylate hydroxylase